MKRQKLYCSLYAAAGKIFTRFLGASAEEVSESLFSEVVVTGETRHFSHKVLKIW